MLQIAVLDDYQRMARSLADWRRLGDAVEVVFFHEPIAQPSLAGTLRDFDALVVMRERTFLSRGVLSELDRLRLVVTTGMRNAALDVAYLRAKGVVVSGTNGSSAPTLPGVPSPVEVAFALILATTKRVVLEDRALRGGYWQLGIPGRLGGATLGLAGLGRLGSAMVAPARAFGMEVIAWSENLSVARADEFGVEPVSKAALLQRSDVLSIHLVLSERTRGLFGAAELAAMKPSAVLVNTARGPIVDEVALIEALRRKVIVAAGLDVYDTEPLPAGHPLLELENLVLLPHLGYVTEADLKVMYQEAVEDIAAYLAGSPIRQLEG